MKDEDGGNFVGVTTRRHKGSSEFGRSWGGVNKRRHKELLGVRFERM